MVDNSLDSSHVRPVLTGVTDFMKTIDRHIGLELLAKSAVAGFWLTCVFAFVSLIEIVEAYGTRFEVAAVAKLLGLAIPTMIYQLAPMILLIGTLLLLFYN